MPVSTKNTETIRAQINGYQMGVAPANFADSDKGVSPAFGAFVSMKPASVGQLFPAGLPQLS
jgi:hypothetical protein